MIFFEKKCECEWVDLGGEQADEEPATPADGQLRKEESACRQKKKKERIVQYGDLDRCKHL